MKLKINILQRLRISIFVKLFFVMLITGLITFALIITFMGSQFTEKMGLIIHKNIENYFSYIAADLGSPPDTLRAREYAQSFAIYIQYKSPHLNWSSFERDTISQYQQKFGPFSRRKRQINKFVLHQDFVIQNADGSKYIFNVDVRKFIWDHDKKLLLLLLFIGIAFLISFLLIRRILKPVKFLNDGVRQVSKGSLDYTIPVSRNDELADLSNSFNEMTQKIKEMINSREQLLLDVSHELRSPLTRIRVALELMPDGKNKSSIEEDLSELEAMITEILETEQFKQTQGSQDFKKHDLSILIRNAASEFKERKPGIKLSVVPGNMMARFDYERMEIVIKNLLENALKYSKTNSKPVEIFMEKEERQVTIRIVDDGTGIPAEHLPYVFEPFYRIDKSRSKKSGGYGLGLSLCKRIMEYHKGSISIKPNDNSKGITVKLILPL